MARSKGHLPGDPATSGVLAVVFLAVTLFLCKQGNAVAELRDRLGPSPLAVTGLSGAPTRPGSSVFPTPTSLATTPIPLSANQFGTPVPVLATANAIATEHAQSLTETSQPTSTLASNLLSATSPTASDTPLTVDDPGSQILPSVTASTAVTGNPTTTSSTATSATAGPPTRAPSTATRPATSAPTPSLPATPTSAPSIAAPVLLGSKATGGSIFLAWSYAGKLGANDYFNVRVWQDGQPPHDIAFVQLTDYTIDGTFPSGTYNWTIAVIHKQVGQIQLVSVAATTLRFTWLPGRSGGGPSTH